MKSEIISKLKELSKYDSFMLLRLYRRYIKQQKLMREYPDDRDFIEKRYLHDIGEKIDLENPKRFTEKLQWLKLYNRNPVTAQCADKYLVREYIKEKGYSYLLNDLYAVVTDADDLQIDKLPERFVIKASHGSGMNFICTDKNKVRWKSKKRIFRMWLKMSLYIEGREWVYKVNTPRLVVEKYLEDDSGALRDYKISCFNGRPEFVQVDSDRYGAHKRSYYTVDWKMLPFITSDYPPCEAQKPDNFGEMLKIAETLSEGFPFIRVDLYNCNGKIYFGELTFFDNCGFVRYKPDEYDYIIGSKLKLPDAKTE